MSITNPTNVAGPYTPDGATTAFPFNFLALSSAELQVEQGGYVLSPAGYTVTLAGEGGTVVFGTPPALGSGALTIVGSPSFTQSITGTSAVLPGVVAKGFDASVARDIALKRRFDTILAGGTTDPIALRSALGIEGLRQLTSAGADATGATNSGPALAAATGSYLVTPGTYLVSTNTTIAARLVILPGALFQVAAGVLLTFAVEPQILTTGQVFDMAGAAATVAGLRDTYVKAFGARSDGTGNCDGALQSAYASGSREIRYGAGAYAHNATRSWTTGVVLEGLAPHVTELRYGHNGDFLAADPAGAWPAPTIRNLSLTKTGTRPTAGAAIKFTRAPEANVENVHLRNVFRGVELDGGTTGGQDTYLTKLRAWYFVDRFISLTNLNSVRVEQFFGMGGGDPTYGEGYHGANSTGILLKDKAEGHKFSDGEIVLARFGLHADATIDAQAYRPYNNYFTNVEFDGCDICCFLRQTYETNFTACWFSARTYDGGASDPNAGYAFNADSGKGLYVTDSRIVYCDRDGVLLGPNFDGATFQNVECIYNDLHNETRGGYRINGAKNVSIIGGRCGNPAGYLNQGFTGAQTDPQAYGVVLDGAWSNVTVRDVADLGSNRIAPLLIASLGTGLVIDVKLKARARTTGVGWVIASPAPTYTTTLAAGIVPGPSASSARIWQVASTANFKIGDIVTLSWSNPTWKTADVATAGQTHITKIVGIADGTHIEVCDPMMESVTADVTWAPDATSAGPTVAAQTPIVGAKIKIEMDASQLGTLRYLTDISLAAAPVFTFPAHGLANDTLVTVVLNVDTAGWSGFDGLVTNSTANTFQIAGAASTVGRPAFTPGSATVREAVHGILLHGLSEPELDIVVRDCPRGGGAVIMESCYAPSGRLKAVSCGSGGYASVFVGAGNAKGLRVEVVSPVGFGVVLGCNGGSLTINCDDSRLARGIKLQRTRDCTITTGGASNAGATGLALAGGSRRNSIFGGNFSSASRGTQNVGLWHNNAYNCDNRYYGLTCLNNGNWDIQVFALDTGNMFFGCRYDPAKVYNPGQAVFIDMQTSALGVTDSGGAGFKTITLRQPNYAA